MNINSDYFYLSLEIILILFENYQSQEELEFFIDVIPKIVIENNLTSYYLT